MAGNELQLMRKYFFDRMVNDATFLSLFGATNLAARIGQPLSEQGAAYPLINIRGLGSTGGGLLRKQNSSVDYVWAKRKFLVVAINNHRSYLSGLADRMYELFKLNQSVAVTGGRIFECYVEDLENFYEHQYADSSGKIYSEKGNVWTISAKAD
jgi:hypothetical protein